MLKSTQDIILNYETMVKLVIMQSCIKWMTLDISRFWNKS